MPIVRAYLKIKIIRKNAKGVELSRNFPINNRDYLTSQPESESIKRWADQIPFVASLILHSGNIVAIYPYDHLYQSGNNIATR